MQKRVLVVGVFVLFTIEAANASIGLGDAGKVKIFSDFRLRAEYDERTKADGTKQDRNRLRYRARMGVKYQVNDNWSAGIRMATNITSINSPHVTFGEASDIGFDQAYLMYKKEGMKIGAGKQPLNLWNSSEMIWDKDFNPDALSYTHKLGGFKLNTAHVILQDNGWNGTDDKIEMLQCVYGKETTTVALGYFNVNDGSAAENIFTLSGQYTVSDWRTVIDVSSSDADVENLAYALQFRKDFGGDMGVRLYYLHVEAQSIPGDGRYGQDDFPDQNGAGLSNFEGFRLQYDQKLDKNIAMDVRFYSMSAIDDAFSAMAGAGQPYFSDKDRIRLQMNINLKF